MVARVRIGCPLLLAFAFLCGPAQAAQVFEDETRVAGHSPEGWAMSYVASATLLTGFGGPPQLDPGQWSIGAELATIPRLSDDQRRVGFAGEKQEDLNKSALFGRLRSWVGLPFEFVGEIAYTPDIEINDVRAKRLFSLALGRAFRLDPNWRASMRLFAQSGRARSDITCPADLAGDRDFERNPVGCAAPSSDEIRLRYSGLDLGLAWHSSPSSMRYHLGAGIARLAPSVQVDARLMPDALDRSKLNTTSYARFLSVGIGNAWRAEAEWAAELLYVPLDVRREASARRENDPYWSVRLLLRWHPRVLR